MQIFKENDCTLCQKSLLSRYVGIFLESVTFLNCRKSDYATFVDEVNLISAFATGT